MKQITTLVLLSVLIFASCADQDTMPLHFIEGHINGKRTIYPQKDFINVSPSNSYSKEFKSTWMQALTEKGYWYINIYNTPLDSIEIPYEVPVGNGLINWNNAKGSSNENCQGFDAGCTYSGMTDEETRITITELSSSLIAGEFSGKLILIGTGFHPFKDTSDFLTITNGKFRIAYKVER